MLEIIVCIWLSASIFMSAVMSSTLTDSRSITSPVAKGTNTPGVGGTTNEVPALGFLAFTTVLKQPNGEPLEDKITSPSRGLRADVDGVSGTNEDDFEGCTGV